MNKYSIRLAILVTLLMFTQTYVLNMFRQQTAMKKLISVLYVVLAVHMTCGSTYAVYVVMRGSGWKGDYDYFTINALR